MKFREFLVESKIDAEAVLNAMLKKDKYVLSDYGDEAVYQAIETVLDNYIKPSKGQLDDIVDDVMAELE